jgi:hexulose-6-phosphate isomerase
MGKNRIKIGIMNGRLSAQMGNQIQSFPTDSWRDEFKKAQNCGFDTIEWVFDQNPNPIMKNDGIEEIKLLSKKHNIKVIAICADYFMQKMLFDVKKSTLVENLAVLKKLIEQCYKIDAKILELPFVDSSSLKTQNNRNEIVENLQQVTDFANSQNVRLTLETDLRPSEFKELLEKFGSSVGANYDTGNSTALGYDVKEELQILKPWLSNVHVKDRLYRGGTVEFGTGDTDFDLVFSTLAKINYNGQLIIQGAREDQKMIEPQETCKKYLEFVRAYVIKYNLLASENRVNSL